MLSLIDGINDVPGVFIIATSSKPNSIDEAMRRAGRLDKEIEIGVPTSIEREEILVVLLNDMNIVVNDDNNNCNNDNISSVIVKNIAQKSHGMVGSDLLQVLKESLYYSLMRNVSISYTSSSLSCNEIVNSEILHNELSKLDINDNNKYNDSSTQSSENKFTSIEKILPYSFSNNIKNNYKSILNEIDFLNGLSKVTPSALREVVIEIPSVRWNEIGGMEKVKQSLREVLFIYIIELLFNLYYLFINLIFKSYLY
jgi:SpoVK/Ycf46/Vps4 family AAA+-type ATPase